jgi:uncharacterized protein YndB with AHSA1/START domain
MSVKKEPSGRRSVAVEVEVPGTPEEVWRAIATGPGVSSWFVPCEVDERDGGTVTCHFGPGFDSTATVTAWEPPHRFTAESSLGPGAPAFATEWVVEARSGGTCVVRVVHSLFAESDDWDGQLEGTESGWPGFFRILRLYLTHFPGRHGATLQAVQISAAPLAQVWPELTGALGLAGVAPGERWSAPAGVPPFAGTVEQAGEGSHPDLLLRLDQPAPGIAHLSAHDQGCPACMAIRFYLYGDEAADVARRDEPLWQEWLKERFPAAGGAAGA